MSGTGKIGKAGRVGMLGHTMPDLRERVKAEMARQGVSAYRLAQLLKGKRPGRKDVPAPTLYQWLRGDNDLNSGDLGLVFDVLGMTTTPVARKAK
jgi:hypothetical protein